MTAGGRPRPEQRNEDFPWDTFDSEAYLAHNYGTVRDDDGQILAFVRDFFVRSSPSLGHREAMRGIDVGTGPNLYPALAMLPFCRDITLYEYSKSNVDWLASQHAAHWPSWETVWCDFWKLLCEDPVYAGTEQPEMGAELSRRTRVIWGNVFDLDESRHGRFDIGTMFFGPESLTAQTSEFRSAIDHFLAVLRPNAPFAIALMEHSKGWHAGAAHFPATDIGLRDITAFLDGRVSDLRFERIGTGDAPVREGYTGMIVVCGRIAHRPE
jgi:hypothetical protein